MKELLSLYLTIGSLRYLLNIQCLYIALIYHFVHLKKNLPKESKYLQSELLSRSLRLFRKFHHQFQVRLSKIQRWQKLFRSLRNKALFNHRSATEAHGVNACRGYDLHPSKGKQCPKFKVQCNKVQ